MTVPVRQLGILQSISIPTGKFIVTWVYRSKLAEVRGPCQRGGRTHSYSSCSRQRDGVDQSPAESLSALRNPNLLLSRKPAASGGRCKTRRFCRRKSGHPAARRPRQFDDSRSPVGSSHTLAGRPRRPVLSQQDRWQAARSRCAGCLQNRPRQSARGRRGGTAASRS